MPASAQAMKRFLQLGILIALLISAPAVRASAPTFHGSASSPADNGSQADNAVLTVTPPASMTSGDLVVVMCFVQVATPSANWTFANTGGQSWVGSLDITGANDMDMQLFWTQFNGTWSADPQFTGPSESGTQPISCIMHVWRPSAAGTWQQDTALAGGAEASADPATVTGITPNKRDTVSLACIAIPNASTFTEDSADWTITSTAQYRNTAGSDMSISCAYKLQGAAAATGDASFNPSTAAAGISFTMAWNNSLVPTISPNTADGNDFGSDTTPTLEATGTDGNADDVRYNFQIDDGTIEISSYAESNRDGSYLLTTGASIAGVGQSFTSKAAAGKLGAVQFYIKRDLSPTGNAVAKLYAHSGTFGTSSVPTGAALATSDNVDVSTLADSFSLVEFVFSGAQQYQMANSTNYVITVEYSSGSGSTGIEVGTDGSSPGHGGNTSSLTGGSWSQETRDTIFYLDEVPLLSKLSGTDSGFANTVTGGDTDPFNSGEKVSFTVQAGDALAGGTWYWRARAKDPNGGNIYSIWTTTRNFTISTGATYNDSITVTADVNDGAPSTVLGAVGSVSAAADVNDGAPSTVLVAVASFSHAATSGYTPLGNADFPSAASMAATGGTAIQGGLSIDKDFTLTTSNAATTSGALDRQGAMSAAADVNDGSPATQLDAVGAVTPAATSGYTPAAIGDLLASATAAATSGYTAAGLRDAFPSVSAAGTAGTAAQGGLALDGSISAAASSGYTPVGNFDASPSGSFAATAATTAAGNADYPAAITASATAATATLGNRDSFHSLTFSSTDATTTQGGLSIDGAITNAATSGYTAAGSISFDKAIAIATTNTVALVGNADFPVSLSAGATVLVVDAGALDRFASIAAGATATTNTEGVLQSTTYESSISLNGTTGATTAAVFSATPTMSLAATNGVSTAGVFVTAGTVTVATSNATSTATFVGAGASMSVSSTASVVPGTVLNAAGNVSLPAVGTTTDAAVLNAVGSVSLNTVPAASFLTFDARIPSIEGQEPSRPRLGVEPERPRSGSEGERPRSGVEPRRSVTQ